jgi:hypothetical protein
MPDLVDVTTAEPEAVAAEMARRQALKAMGIVSYVSRYDLPGAAPAQRQSLSPPPAPPVTQPPDAPRSKGSSTVSSQRVQSHAAPESSVVKPAGDAVQFSMLIVSAGQFLWLEQLPDGLIRQDQLALVNSMACAVSGAGFEMTQQQFDWPLRGNSALGSDAESAKQALQGLIQRMAREVDARRVVAMGDCQFLPDRIAQSAVSIPSTMAMLVDATHKQAAWQSLKPLKALDASA